jgi:hypothetical protein
MKVFHPRLHRLLRRRDHNPLLENIMRTANLLLSLTLTASLLPGCASLRPVSDTVVAAGGVRVVLKERDRKLFKLMVINETQQPVMIDRDAITLEVGGEEHRRNPGGASTMYSIPPGGFHQVNVKYDLPLVSEGEHALLQFKNAVFVGGVPVYVDPIVFRAE